MVRAQTKPRLPESFTSQGAMVNTILWDACSLDYVYVVLNEMHKNYEK